MYLYFSSWSPILRERAAMAFARRRDQAPITALVAMLESPELNTRLGQLLPILRFRPFHFAVVPVRCIAGSVQDDLSLFLAEAFVEVRASTEHIEPDQVLCLHDVLLNFVEIISVDRGQRILLAIDDAQLQSHEHVGER